MRIVTALHPEHGRSYYLVDEQKRIVGRFQSKVQAEAAKAKPFNNKLAQEKQP